VGPVLLKVLAMLALKVTPVMAEDDPVVLSSVSELLWVSRSHHALRERGSDRKTALRQSGRQLTVYALV
jgi:hypothetical protein